MVKEQYKPLLEQILELLDTAYEATLELFAQYENGNRSAADRLTSDLRSVIGAVSGAQKPLIAQLEHSYTGEMLENVEDTLDCMARAMQSGDSERAAGLLEFQLLPFLHILREAFYFWGSVYPDRSRTDRYYQEEFAAHFRNPHTLESPATPHRLTVFVTAYNHLETTKNCIEHLLKETDFEKLNAELILIDHGSTDGTLEYFESLGVGRVIHFRRNVRMYMFAMLPLICRGEYFSFVSNDILVARDWAEILLNCMESDPNIIAAVPATPNISNFQMTDVPTYDPEEFIAWAREHNQPNPALWSDRARLMPPLGMYRAEAVNRIGFADPLLYSMEFWDDDFSFRARRAGYRQLVCGDVACYHFGSVTGSEAQKKEGTLQYGRELFLWKNGVDPWGNGYGYDPPAINLLRQVLPEGQESAVLGLDCGMGDTPLQIRNEFRYRRRDCALYQLTCQEEYLPDLKALSVEASYFPRLADGLDSAFEGVSFSIVYLGRDIGRYEDYPRLLAAISRRLIPGGRLVFSCSNAFLGTTIQALLNGSLPANAARFVLTDPSQIQKEAEKSFSHVRAFPLNQEIPALREFIVEIYGEGEHVAQILARMQKEKDYFLCIK